MQAKKPDFKIFAGGAEDGELHDFPDVTRGWGVTKLQTNKKPPLSWMNGAFNRVDNNFYYLLQNGLVEWTSEIEYSANAITQQNGVIYRAKEAVKGESPSASAKWEKLFTDKVGTSDFIGMSQKAVTNALGSKISASDLTQTITSDKLKAPSNFAVNTALKEQDPRQWGVGVASVSLIGATSTSGFVSYANSNFATNDGWPNIGGGFQSAYNPDRRAQFFIGTKGDTYVRFSLKVGADKSTPWYSVYTSGNTTVDPNGVLTTKQDTVTLTTKDLAKETGNSHSKVMSQKAVSDAFQPKGDYGAKNTASKSDHGWWKCASTGIIIQWGRGAGTRNFPIAFPTEVCSITAAVNQSDGDNEIGARITNVSKTSFKVSSGKGKESYPYYWQAIGF